MRITLVVIVVVVVVAGLWGRHFPFFLSFFLPSSELYSQIIIELDVVGKPKHNHKWRRRRGGEGKRECGHATSFPGSSEPSTSTFHWGKVRYVPHRLRVV